MKLPQSTWLTLITLGVLVGLFGTAAIKANQRFGDVIKQGGSEELAVEVAELTKNSRRLRSQVVSLEEELSRLEGSVRDVRQTNETLESSILRFNLLLGLQPGVGPGVIVAPRQELDVTQLLDLTNGLRSIGAEAIAINGERVTARTALSGTKFLLPLTVLAVGDAQVLRDGLVSNGGVLEQLGIAADVQTDEQLRMPTKTVESMLYWPQPS